MSQSSSEPTGDRAAVVADERRLAAAIGANLRSLRTQQGLTLEALAKLSSVSKSMLGEIELAHTTPNISLLWRIANALGVPVSEFLQPRDREPLQILRAEADGGQEVVRALNPAPLRGRVKFEELRLAPGAEQEENLPAGTSVSLVVAVGELALAAGDNLHRLGAGDAAQFNADLPHRYSNPAAAETIVYRVLAYPVNLSFG